MMLCGDEKVLWMVKCMMSNSEEELLVIEQRLPTSTNIIRFLIAVACAGGEGGGGGGLRRGRGRSSLFTLLNSPTRSSWLKKTPFYVREHALLARRTCPSWGKKGMFFNAVCNTLIAWRLQTRL